MSFWTDVAHNLGFGTSQETNNAEDALQKSKEAYQNLAMPELTPEMAQKAQVSNEGPSAYNNIGTDPEAKEAQMSQLAALKALQANGGRSASTDADLARIQQATNANAKGQRDAILQNASARGMAGSGNSLLAQLASSQNATNNQSAQDMAVAGQNADRALQAGNAAANIGANMQNMDYNQQANKAAATDAINRFNAGQNTANSQYNAGVGNQAQQYNTGLQQQGYQNKFNQAAGISGANTANANFNQGLGATKSQMTGNILGSVIGGGSAIAAKAASGGAAWSGGKVPGTAVVPGDSHFNDFVNVKTSPGEVVVPRSIAKSGDSNAIASFVKNPPKIKAPMSADKNKEAMLSALANIKRRRA